VLEMKYAAKGLPLPKIVFASAFHDYRGDVVGTHRCSVRVEDTYHQMSRDINLFAPQYSAHDDAMDQE
jgi:hypothetical protein